MIETLIAKIGLPVLINVLAESLSQMDSPIAKEAAKALSGVDQAIADGRISHEQLAEAHRHAEKMAEMKSEEHQETLREINKTMRMELASEDKYVRRMRPTFGYLMAITWAAQMLGLAYVIVFETEQSGVVLSAMSSLTAIWAVGLSVLGIYVYKRSEDKRGSGIETIFWNRRK
jgi:hypothetical protein